MIRCHCPHCRTEMELGAAAVGEVIVCGRCSNSFRLAGPAMRACPDCGRELSRHAAACPHCGRPLAGEAPVHSVHSALNSVVRSKWHDVVKWWSRL